MNEVWAWLKLFFFYQYHSNTESHPKERQSAPALIKSLVQVIVPATKKLSWHKKTPFLCGDSLTVPATHKHYINMVPNASTLISPGKCWVRTFFQKQICRTFPGLRFFQDSQIHIFIPKSTFYPTSGYINNDFVL